jgi:hypothetical protein
MGRGGIAAMADVTEDKTTEDTTEETGSKPEELGDAGKRALEAERKARRAAESRLRELEAKAKEAEDAEKTEVERLKGQVADLTKRAEGAELTAARYEVAAAKGLSPAQARRLVGSTKEELETDAEEMRVELGLDKKDEEKKGDEGKDKEKETEGDAFGGRPKENLRSGASNSEDEEVDAEKLAGDILDKRF